MRTEGTKNQDRMCGPTGLFLEQLVCSLMGDPQETAQNTHTRVIPAEGQGSWGLRTLT